MTAVLIASSIMAEMKPPCTAPVGLANICGTSNSMRTHCSSCESAARRMPSVSEQGGRFFEFWKRASMSASDTRGFVSSVKTGAPYLRR